MPRYTQRRIDLYVLHAHLRDEPPDYTVFLEYLSSIPRPQRIGRIGSRVVAVTEIEDVAPHVAQLTVVEGDEDTVPVVLDMSTGADRDIELGRSEVVVTKTYALIDFQARFAFVMYNHRGAKAEDIAILLRSLLRMNPDWEYLELEMTPAIDESFDRAIDRFSRITSASAVIARPNFDWEDHAGQLLEAADQSNAQDVEIAMHAGRGASLSRDSGIVAFLKQQVVQNLPFLKDAVVRGYREGENAPTAIRLGRHIAHQRVRVPFDNRGQVDERSIRHRLRAYWEGWRQT